MEIAWRFGRWWFSVESGLNPKKDPSPIKPPKHNPTVGFVMPSSDYVEETPTHLE